MRTRTRNIAVRTKVIPAAAVPVAISYCNGSSATATYNRAGATIVTAGREERISDDLGKGQSNACRHRQYDYDVSDNQLSGSYAGGVPGAWEVSTQTAPYFWVVEYGGYLKSLMAWDVNTDANIIPPRWAMSGYPDESAVANGLLQRARQLKADVLLNIVEANQVWPAINSLARALPVMAAHWWELRKVLRTASAAFLAWKFGISPILSDMMAVQRFLPKISVDLERHANGDKTRFSQIFNLVTGHDSSNYLSGTGGDAPYVTYKFFTQGRLVDSPVIRYVLVVKPIVKYRTSFFQKASHLMSRFVSSPASLAWELVPFSFVVDWFVDLRSTLNTLDKALGSSPYAVESFTRSFRYAMATDHYIETFSPCNGNALMSYRSASAQYKHYDRSNVQAGSLPIWNPRFGKNQAAISAALITQALLKIPGAMRF